MSLETCGWLILLFPLGGAVLIALHVADPAVARSTA